MAAVAHLLVGTWKLLSFITEYQSTDERQEPFGTAPKGYLILGETGRMMTVITAGERKRGTADEDLLHLYRTMLAYTGTYEVTGDRFITNVEVSWNEAWNGTQQVRFFKVDGNRLALTSAWLPHPVLREAPMLRAVASWERERPRPGA